MHERKSCSIRWSALALFKITKCLVYAFAICVKGNRNHHVTRFSNTQSCTVLGTRKSQREGEIQVQVNRVTVRKKSVTLTPLESIVKINKKMWTFPTVMMIMMMVQGRIRCCVQVIKRN